MRLQIVKPKLVSQPQKKTNMDKLYAAFEVRKKLLAAIVGVIVAVLGDRAGVSGEALTLAVVTIVSYILGTALEDGLRGRN